MTTPALEVPLTGDAVPGEPARRPRGLHRRRAGRRRDRAPGVPQRGALHRAAVRRAARPAQRDMLTTSTAAASARTSSSRRATPRRSCSTAREAIAAWSRMSYGFMGRTPDYKAAFMADARRRPRVLRAVRGQRRGLVPNVRAQSALFLNHVLINPPIDRNQAGARGGGRLRPRREGARRRHRRHRARRCSRPARRSRTPRSSRRTARRSWRRARPRTSRSSSSPAGHAGPEAAVAAAPTRRRRDSPFDHPLSSRFDENDAVHDLRRRVHPVGERPRLPRRREGDRLLRAVRVLEPLHAPGRARAWP